MNTLTVEVKGKTFKGKDAITALTALLARGFTLSPSYILWDELDRPAGTLCYIQKGKGNQAEVVGQLSYLRGDEVSGEIVSSICLGFEIAKKKREIKPRLVVKEVQ